MDRVHRFLESLPGLGRQRAGEDLMLLRIGGSGAYALGGGRGRGGGAGADLDGGTRILRQGGEREQAGKNDG